MSLILIAIASAAGCVVGVAASGNHGSRRKWLSGGILLMALWVVLLIVAVTS